ncbi:MAG: CoB--CoM heterodisulfide reductase iron-sulfur subunit A family protein [Deltaproteobacteria bacterium]|nr:CoB--CoM heterodisulfide reductase iron-sulfur subunit A family protein [Deltaproteobacteria bacterium]
MNPSGKQMMVIGGGITGISAAVDLARLGVTVFLVENSGSLGGHAARLSCKATDRCVACGACMVEEKIRQATSNANIRIYLNTRVDKIDRDKRFEVTLKQDGQMPHIDVDAILMASGFAPFHPVNKPYGYGRFENVMTSLELDRMLRQSGAVTRPSDSQFPRNMAFIQCVGSRDSSLGHLWCSKICCGAALRMARCIQNRQQGMEATFFYIDVQNFGKNFQIYYADSRQRVRMIRSIPADVLKTADDRLKLSYFDPDTQAYQEAVFDMVILSIGLMPSESTRNLAAMLNIDMAGFAYARKTPIPLPEGVFAAGAALEPMSIAESILSAGKAAGNIYRYLETSSQT